MDIIDMILVHTVEWEYFFIFPIKSIKSIPPAPAGPSPHCPPPVVIPHDRWRHVSVGAANNTALMQYIPRIMYTVCAWLAYAGVRYQLLFRNHFVYVPSQWETTLHCNVVSHWLGAYTKWSMLFRIVSKGLCKNWTEEIETFNYYFFWYAICMPNYIQ